MINPANTRQVRSVSCSVRMLDSAPTSPSLQSQHTRYIHTLWWYLMMSEDTTKQLFRWWRDLLRTWWVFWPHKTRGRLTVLAGGDVFESQPDQHKTGLSLLVHTITWQPPLSGNIIAGFCFCWCKNSIFFAQTARNHSDKLLEHWHIAFKIRITFTTTWGIRLLCRRNV